MLLSASNMAMLEAESNIAYKSTSTIWRQQSRIQRPPYPGKAHGLWLLALGCRAKNDFFQSERMAKSQKPRAKNGFLARHQLPGPDCGLDHRIHQGHAQAAFFQLHKAFNGAAGGRSYGVFQQRWVMSGLKRKLGRTIKSLSGQRRGHLTRQPDLHPGFSQRFQDHKSECRPARGKRR